MGAGASHHHRCTHRYDGPSPDGAFVLEIIKATKVPHADALSPPDPFVRLQLQDAKGMTPLSAWYSTPFCSDTTDPVWNSFINLHRNIDNNPGCIVRFELWDRDRFCRDDLLGVATRPAEHLARCPLPQTLEMEPTTRKGRDALINCTLHVRFVSTAPPNRAIVYLIRHGQSEWNAATLCDVRATVATVDHGLTLTGAEQAMDLHDASIGCKRSHHTSSNSSSWSGLSDGCGGEDSGVGTGQCPPAASASAPGKASGAKTNATTPPPFLDEFLSASGVFCSPFARATQTALVALHDHPAVVAHGITLVRAAREIKNAFSRDSVGKAAGDEIAQRAKVKLRDLLGARAAVYEGVKVNFNDALYCWWTPVHDLDTLAEAQTRVLRVLNACRYAGCGDAPTIVVGHSLFFRELLRLCLAPVLRNRADLTARKMPNGSCLRLCLEYEDNTVPRIVSADFVFGTGPLRRGSVRAAAEALPMRGCSRQPEPLADIEEDQEDKDDEDGRLSPFFRRADCSCLGVGMPEWGPAVADPQQLQHSYGVRESEPEHKDQALGKTDNTDEHHSNTTATVTTQRFGSGAKVTLV
eukprot:m.105409 g.105409  ORF g.105409 m.105409 type:complete len:581 (+) comp15714_c0_seq2:133-1875(+)